jgi:hypothetical protein
VNEGKKASKRRDDPGQSRAFIEKAREIGADDGSPRLADSLIERLARRPPEPRAPRPQKKPSGA